MGSQARRLEHDHRVRSVLEDAALQRLQGVLEGEAVTWSGSFVQGPHLVPACTTKVNTNARYQ
jgi:hypothetical protein